MNERGHPVDGWSLTRATSNQSLCDVVEECCYKSEQSLMPKPMSIWDPPRDFKEVVPDGPPSRRLTATIRNPTIDDADLRNGPVVFQWPGAELFLLCRVVEVVKSYSTDIHGRLLVHWYLEADVLKIAQRGLPFLQARQSLLEA